MKESQAEKEISDILNKYHETNKDLIITSILVTTKFDDKGVSQSVKVHPERL